MNLQSETARVSSYQFRPIQPDVLFLIRVKIGNVMSLHQSFWLRYLPSCDGLRTLSP
jgi:hypothetical protein